MLGVTLQWSSILSRKSSNSLRCFMLQTLELSAYVNKPAGLFDLFDCTWTVAIPFVLVES